MKEVRAHDPHLSRQRVDRDLGAGGAIGEVEETAALSLCRRSQWISGVL